jgi:hypothetical protein
MLGRLLVLMAGAQATWNPGDKSANVVLSGGSVVATRGATGDVGAVRAIFPRNSGKWHFEIMVAAAGGGFPNYPNFGVANASASLTSVPGADTNSAIYQEDGRVFFNGQIAQLATFGDGDTVAVELDLDNDLLYFQIEGGSRSPGYDISAMTGPVFPFATFRNTGNQVTANFGDTAFTITPTSGYLAWGI